MKLLRDTWLMFHRYFVIFISNPAWVIIGVAQPVLYLLLFAPLLKSLVHIPGFPSGGAYNVFVPGLLIQLGLFGASGVGFALIAELRAGVIERFRVTPVSRLSLLLGRALRDILTLLIQSLILLGLAIPFGLKPTAAGVLVMLGLVALIGLGMSSLAYAAALALKDENSYAPLVFTLSLPLLLLSGVLLPPRSTRSRTRSPPPATFSTATAALRTCGRDWPSWRRLPSWGLPSVHGGSHARSRRVCMLRGGEPAISGGSVRAGDAPHW
jgi:ABC-2 type transport system permease protein